jgi:shikimate dehydrogenase
MTRETSAELVGLIGHPVAHSRSPALQQAALDASGIAARYALWDTAPRDLAQRVASLRTPGMLGANVTVPHKRDVMPFLDESAPSALRLAGSVNTIVVTRRNGITRLVGHSTDAAGLSAALGEAGVALAGQRVVLLGAGGAAHAVAGLVASEDAQTLVVAARRLEAAVELTQDLSLRLPASMTRVRPTTLSDSNLASVLAESDLLINATSAGMEGTADGDSPLDLALLAYCAAHAFVCDLVYAPPETPLLRAARALGLRTMNGLSMLLHQGAAAFTLWTGQSAPLAAMRAALGMAVTG